MEFSAALPRALSIYTLCNPASTHNPLHFFNAAFAKLQANPLSSIAITIYYKKMASGIISKSSPRQLLSKIATNDRHGENSPYFDGWKAYDQDPFHPTQNPEGVIQMGLAENQV